ncbi:MAG TPA: class I SAM-dependent methyltransferase [Solirubrobacteraceae bacterium]|nr:class I SAM-dependent methyltransferase [Solirubrobacteraceae bacterium]
MWARMGELGRRVRAGVRRRVDMRRHRGGAVRCPICGGSWDVFKDDRNRPNALCWSCGSHERHRAVWLLLERRPELLRDASALLHFAPEYCLRERLRRAAAEHGLRYVTGDLDPTGVDLVLDLSGLDLPDGAFDAVICSHVLEHVPDDALAMRELRRITARGGWCLVLVPLDLEREATYEDPSITDPAGRLAAFWQHDHVRLYAPDVRRRLADAGFEVEVIRAREAFADVADAAGLGRTDWLLLCR